MTFELWCRVRHRSGGRQLRPQLGRQESTICLCQTAPYLVQSRFLKINEGPWWIYEGTMGCNYDKWLCSFLESHLKGGDLALITFSVHEQHPVGCHWTHSYKILRGHLLLWQFLLFTFFESLYSLFERARGICLMIPFLNGEVTGVTCVPECMFMKLCVDVFVRMRVWTEWLWLLLYSLLNFLEELFCFLMPHCEDKHSYTFTFYFHFPADNWVCRLCQQEEERQNVPQVLYSLKFHLQVKELSFLPPCWEHLFALLFCLTGLPLIRTKRHEEAPWRLSVGMTSLQNTFYSLGNSRGVARYALKGLLCWPKVLHATSLHTSFFLSLQANLGCLWFLGTGVPKTAHWFKLIWIVSSVHFCHVKSRAPFL